jgi:hypothetical protein
MATATQPALNLRTATLLLVGAVLGMNVWATVLFVPVTAARSAEIIHRALPLWLLGVPLVLLALGMLRGSRVVLLGLFPISLAVLSAGFRGPGGQDVYSVWSFGIAALSLVAFLVGMAAAIEVQSRQDDALARSPLKLPPLSEKWKRRRRVYWLLTLASAALPLTLIYAMDFDARTAASLRQEYGPAAEDAQVLLTVGALTLWVWIFSIFFMDPLERHRRGDADLYLALREEASLARVGRVRRGFYLVGLIALLLMGLLVWLRRRYG